MSSINPTTVPSKTLSASITASATSFTVSDILGWDGSALTSANFGTKAYGVFRNSSNTVIELFEFDPSTIASASITINYRGLKFDGTLDTEVAGNKKAWTKGDTFVDLGSDVPQLLQHMVRIIGSPAIIDQLQYSTELTPTDRKDLVTKGYVDDNVSGGTVSLNRLVVAGDAGETVAQGELVYYDDTDNEWKLTDADTATTVNEVLLGIAQGAGTDGNPIASGVLIRGLDETQTGMTVGVKLYASNTAGAIAESAGTTEKIIGFSKTATALYFDPYFGAFLTASEKDALVGASNTPSSTNRFVTEDDLADDTFKFPKIVSFTGDGTWTKDSGLKYVTVEVQAGGGGGGGADTDDNGTNGSAGAGGGYSKKLILASALGATETVTVGAAGSGGISQTSPTSGSSGGNSSFGAHATANGGAGGNTTNAYSAGGTAASGDVNIPGGPGTHGGTMTTYGHSIGGNSVLGHGGMFDNNSTFDGQAATGYGAGGVGGAATASTDPNGQAGTAGVVIVTEYYS